MKNNIFYLGFYTDDKLRKEERVNFPAASSKMNYIKDLLERSNCRVTITNPAWVLGKKTYPGKKRRLSNNIYLKTFFSLKYTNRVNKSLSSRLMKLQLFFYLLRNVKKNDIILVYHSIYYSNLITILKKIKNFTLILELEELYQDVNNLTNKEIKLENKIISLSDKYIVSTNHLLKKLDDTKPYIVINGNFSIKESKVKKFQDHKKHIVYAGIIDTVKKGAFTALSIVQGLSSDYKLHILGFGKEEDIQKLKKEITTFNKNNSIKVLYEGNLPDEKCNTFLQKCDIGLSCQTLEGSYSDTSFPSKIINYLTNGLEVLTVRIPVVEDSEVGNLVYFYDESSYDQARKIISEIKINRNKKIRQLELIDNKILINFKKLMGG